PHGHARCPGEHRHRFTRSDASAANASAARYGRGKPPSRGTGAEETARAVIFASQLSAGRTARREIGYLSAAAFSRGSGLTVSGCTSVRPSTVSLTVYVAAGTIGPRGPGVSL